MASLLSLNEDVQRLILRLLPAKSRSAMCLAHSTIRPLAEESLYAEINLAWNMTIVTATLDPDDYTWKFINAWSHPIIPLLRSLLRRPALAKYVRAIFCLRKISTPSREEELHKLGYLKLPDPPLGDAIAIVAQTSLPYRETWIEHLEACRLDAYLAFLLTQLPCIQHLHLDENTFVENDLLRRVIGSLLFNSKDFPPPPFALPGSLCNLKTVEIDRKTIAFKGKDIIATRDIRNACDLSFFHLPSVKEMILNLDVVGIEDIWAAAGIPRPAAHGTKLEKIQLEGLREAHLAHLFSFTPRLRSFHWVWFWCYAPDERGMSLPCNTLTIALDLLIPALCLVKDTLTELNIHAVTEDKCGGLTAASLRIRGSPCQLSSLSTLRRLTIPLEFLTGFKIPVQDMMAVAKALPQNLEILTLRTDLYTEATYSDYWEEAAFTPCLVAWLADVKSYTPKIRSVYLFASNPDREEWDVADPHYEYLELRKMIRELAANAGIEFHVLTMLHP
ncbi:hypothetical protein V8F20_001419 [Naviculisporaceae sp. PSN 640]